MFCFHHVVRRRLQVHKVHHNLIHSKHHLTQCFRRYNFSIKLNRYLNQCSCKCVYNNYATISYYGKYRHNMMIHSRGKVLHNLCWKPKTWTYPTVNLKILMTVMKPNPTYKTKNYRMSHWIHTLHVRCLLRRRKQGNGVLTKKLCWPRLSSTF